METLGTQTVWNNWASEACMWIFFVVDPFWWFWGTCQVCSGLLLFFTWKNSLIRTQPWGQQYKFWSWLNNCCARRHRSQWETWAWSQATIKPMNIFWLPLCFLPPAWLLLKWKVKPAWNTTLIFTFFDNVPALGSICANQIPWLNNTQSLIQKY